MIRSPSRSRRWIWFFAVLALLAAVAIVVPIVYNLSIQLRPEQLAEARRRWQENAPANYDLEYLVQTSTEGSGEPEKNEYLVQVRAGRVALILDSGEVVYWEPSMAAAAGLGVLALSQGNVDRYGVPALFDAIEAMLKRDTERGRRDFATAQFDPKDGHPYHYVHRIRGTKERIEWNVKLTRVE